MLRRLTYALKLLVIVAGIIGVAVGLGIIATAIWPHRPYLGVGVSITAGSTFAFIVAVF